MASTKIALSQPVLALNNRRIGSRRFWPFVADKCEMLISTGLCGVHGH